MPWYQNETGFYYLKGRYYDPKICRFINADSFASTGQGFTGCNMFAYCNDNPVNLVDENGEISGIDDAIIASTAAIVGLVLITALYSATPAGQSSLDGLIIHAQKVYEKAKTAVICMVENSAADENEIRDQSVYVMRDQNNTVAEEALYHFIRGD